MVEDVRERDAEGEKPGASRRGRTLLAGVGIACLVANGVVLLLVEPLGLFAWVRVTYDIDTLALPVILLLAGAAALALTHGRRFARGVRRTAVAFVAAAVGLVAVRVWATHVEPYLLRVQEVRFASPKVRRELRILHLSDIQSPRVGPWEAEVFARARGLAPDLVLFTGDLLETLSPESFEAELAKMEPLIASLCPHLGCYGVLGNTDVPWPGRASVTPGGMRLLADAEARVVDDGLRLRILGLSLDQSFSRGGTREAVARWLQGVPGGELTIVMGHAPDFVLGVQELPVDLCLAGHTHGGQIRLPLLGPVITLSAVPRAWARGFREVGRTRLNVSGGIGAEHEAGLPSIRFNCRPEMSLITVTPVVDRDHPAP